MHRSFLAVVGLVVLLWALDAPGVRAQNRTTIRLTEGPEDVREQVEERVSSLLTELNRAHYFDERPDLGEQALTAAGRTALLNHWDRMPFRCPEPTIERPLRRGDQPGVYELRPIPLLARASANNEEARQGILILNAEGQITDFLYRSERAAAPETGTIVIRTQPPGATVLSAIGGGARQQSPARFEDVPADLYAFTIREEGYRDVVDTTFSVPANRVAERTVSLRPSTGRLRIAGTPTEAVIRIDDTTEVGPDALVDLSAGTHTVAVETDVFAEWDTTVTVPPGTTTTVRPDLQRRQVPLTVRSDPSGATVYLNEEAIGTTPLDTTLDAGRSYATRIAKEGHVPSRTMQAVASLDTTLDRRVALAPIETRTEAERARVANVQARRLKGMIDLQYALIGESETTYTVTLTARGPDGSALNLDSGTVTGDVGPDIAPGPDKQIRWTTPLPEGATVRLTVDTPGGRNRLYYIVGGAVAAGGATAAALLLGGGDGGSGSSFPDPPGLPN